MGNLLTGLWRLVSTIPGASRLFGQRENVRVRSSSAIGRGRMRATSEPDDVPQAGGVYRHVYKRSRKVVYVGKSSNDLHRRQQEHVRSGRLNLKTMRIEFSPVSPTASETDLCRTERAHIERYRPRGNKHPGGNGRPAAVIRTACKEG